MLTCLSLGPRTSGILRFGFVKNRSTIIYTEKKTQFAFQYCNEILWIQRDWWRLRPLLPVGKNIPC